MDFNDALDYLDFESFTLIQNGTTAQSTVYEGQKTDTGVHLEYYIYDEYWDNSISGYAENRFTIREIDGDETLYKEISALFGKCRVDKWSGFHGENPPGTLDGSSMRFEAILSDGAKVNASGTNNFPKNYRAFSNSIHDLITVTKISSRTFTDGSTYEITLPESWVNVVSAKFSEGLISFSVKQNDGKDISFFIIDNSEYGYSSDTYTGRIEAGRLVSKDDVRFITIRDNYSLSSYLDKLPEEVKQISDTYEEDKQAIINSLHGINGYELQKEDGSTLYMREAEELAENAKMYWLYLNFAGEYSGGIQPTEINGRNYKIIFPKDYAVSSIDDVYNILLNVFSKDFTTKVIDEAVKNKDLIEHNDEVYVAYKKAIKPQSYNSWVNSVIDEGDGKFTIVMDVKMPDSDEPVNINLPVEKNEDGKFVFTDYPYWDKSE